MSRSKRSQSKHDLEVRSIAKKRASQGYKVKADVSGYPKPDTIRGYRPDVIATKRKERKIYEVETPDSVKSARDQKQQKAFIQAADQSKNMTFRRIIKK